MDKEVLSALSAAARDETFLYWVSDHFTHWVSSGLIPEHLLAPSKVQELYQYLLEHRYTLLKTLQK